MTGERPTRRQPSNRLADLEAAEQRAETAAADTYVSEGRMFLFNDAGEILAIADGPDSWDYSVSDEDFDRDESGHPIVADFTEGSDD